MIFQPECMLSEKRFTSNHTAVFFYFRSMLKDKVYNNNRRAEGELKESVHNDWLYYDGIIAMKYYATR
jgi:hypothetical protein